MVTEEIYCASCGDDVFVQVGTEQWTRNLCYICEEEYSIMEMQREMAVTLSKLMIANPSMKVIPMVETEVVADDNFSSWAGSFGKPRLDEVFSEDERIYFRSMDEDELLDQEGDQLDSENKYTYDEIMVLATERVNKLNWEKAIIVPIGSPA